MDPVRPTGGACSSFPLFGSSPLGFSVGLGALVPPGVDELPEEELLAQGPPRVLRVAAVGW